MINRRPKAPKIHCKVCRQRAANQLAAYKTRSNTVYASGTCPPSLTGWHSLFADYDLDITVSKPGHADVAELVVSIGGVRSAPKRVRDLPFTFTPAYFQSDHRWFVKVRREDDK